MTSDSGLYARLHTVLDGARSLTGEPLQVHLDDACGDDHSLRERVVELLAAGCDESSDDVFAEPSLQGSRETLQELLDGDASSWLPERIGEYTILRQIGHGGMGVVYEAEQESPRRHVAIKLLHPMHATPSRMRRFRREAELLGRLQHPGIAHIHEAGTYDVGRGPQPFFAMELVDGVDIRTFCEEQALGREARVELLAQVADAVHYAHERGVIHRDLKPDNVLVDRSGNPRILDFGIARATRHSTGGSSLVTEEGQMVGTLAHMAPEQLVQSKDAISAKVDVYALGVLGFELLVGRLPHLVDDLPISQAIAHLATTEAPRASLFDASLRGDLETILGKALESDRGRRYATAASFASDLRRFLADRPVHARPPSRTYLLRKFARRNKALVGGVAATFLVAVVGAAVATRYALDATRSAGEAIQHARESDRRAAALQRSNYIAGIAAANSAIQQQDYAAAAVALERLPEADRGWENDYLRSKLAHHLGDWETPALVASTAVFDAEGRRMFAALLDGSIGTWELESGRLTQRSPLEGIEWTNRRAVVLNGSSLRFAAVDHDQRVITGSLEGGRPSVIPPALAEGRASVLAWDPSGQRLAYTSGGTQLWDGTRSRPLHEEAVGAAAFDHAGARVALATRGVVSLIDISTGELICSVRLHDDRVQDMRFSPDDSMLAVAGYYRNAYLLNAGDLEVEARLVGHQDVVQSVAWNETGSRLATASNDGTLRLWSTQRFGSTSVFLTGLPAGSVIPAGMSLPVPKVTVRPGGSEVVVVQDRIRRFALEESDVLRGHGSYVYYASFSRDGTMLASADFRQLEVRVWDAHSSQLLGVFRRSAARGGNAQGPWRLDSSETGPPRRKAGDSKQSRVQRFFEARTLEGWDLQTGRAISPDGTMVAHCHRRSTSNLFAVDFPIVPEPGSKAEHDEAQFDGTRNACGETDRPPRGSRWPSPLRGLQCRRRANRHRWK